MPGFKRRRFGNTARRVKRRRISARVPRFRLRLNARQYRNNRVFKVTRWGIAYAGYWVTAGGSNTPSAISTISSTSGNITEAGIQFQLNQVNDYTNFTGLFDRYRITRVKLYFYATGADQNVQVAGSTSTAVSVPLVYLSQDYDNIGGLGQPGYDYPGMLIRKADRSFTYSFSPRLVQQGLITQAGSGGRTAMGRPWVDCGTTDAAYLGLRVFMETQSVTGSFKLSVRVKYWLQFAGTI